MIFVALEEHGKISRRAYPLKRRTHLCRPLKPHETVMLIAGPFPHGQHTRNTTSGAPSDDNGYAAASYPRSVVPAKDVVHVGSSMPSMLGSIIATS